MLTSSVGQGRRQRKETKGEYNDDISSHDDDVIIRHALYMRLDRVQNGIWNLRIIAFLVVCEQLTTESQDELQLIEDLLELLHAWKESKGMR